MSAQQLMMRLVVAESELDSRSVRNGDLTPEQWKHMGDGDQAALDRPALYRRHARSIDFRISFKKYDGSRLNMISS